MNNSKDTHQSKPLVPHVQTPDALNPGRLDYTFEQQRLRILGCTAQAMASTLGGLRFKAGSRPWLQGLSVGLGHAG